MVRQVLEEDWECFAVISDGWSGKVRDTCIFKNSGLFRKLQAGLFFPNWQIATVDVEMPTVILGDPAYPLIP